MLVLILPSRQVEAYDPDIQDRDKPQNIVYSLVKQEQKDIMEIDNNGCLRLIKPLDRDQPSGKISGDCDQNRRLTRNSFKYLQML